MNRATTNPHAAQPTSPAALGKSLWRNRQLILQMTRRDVLGRYKDLPMCSKLELAVAAAFTISALTTRERR
jgi:hypothetical protein